MAHELVRPAQGAGGKARLGQGERRLGPRAEGEAARLEGRLLRDEAEGARRGQFGRERVGRHVHAAALATDERMGPLDRHRQAERLGGRDHVLGIGFAHHEWRVHRPDGRGRASPLRNAGRGERVEVGARAPIADGHLRPIHLDREIVQAQGVGGREAMLQGPDFGAIRAEGRAAIGRVDVVGHGADGRGLHVGSAHRDPGARLRGPEGGRDGVAGVQAGAADLGWTGERASSRGRHGLGSSVRGSGGAG